ncbi:MAG: DUF924 domain-containing protein [Oculatellaceae cyanobacterium Prado106]|jgi:uncharacterized protein (DUF924 family)|nr:DUF924 domain-containing protein [Oculatellaceae cyanobacterium Prado106]
MTLSEETLIEEILQFWFGTPHSEAAQYAQRRKLWFGKSPETDQEIAQRFLTAYEQAAAGAFDEWQRSPSPCLALLLLLDQFPRNLFRGTPKAFATDTKALEVALGAIATQFDQALAPIQRIFIYLPLEHSENLAIQNQSVALFRQLAIADPQLQDTLDFAIRHQQVIEQFGRFPHRNAILNRPTPPAEAEFLQQPGSSF